MSAKITSISNQARWHCTSSYFGCWIVLLSLNFLPTSSILCWCWKDDEAHTVPSSRLQRKPSWGSLFPNSLHFSATCRPRVICAGASPPRAGALPPLSAHVSWSWVTSLAPRRSCSKLSLEKAPLPTMRKRLNDHFAQYPQYVLMWLLIRKFNKQYPG